ncbi:S-layer homology domain-containing protein [Paenibacillus sp. TRM 82003]|nr:S-layer homology domain-containing protein [Paenibacillus sp. TRM 82003]
MERNHFLLTWLLVLSLALPPVWSAPAARAADDAEPPVVDGWVQVSKAEQLLYINAHQADFVTQNIRLMNDIALSGVDNWKPFGGNDVAPFSRTFDGGGFRVVGVSIVDDDDDASDDYTYAGFFGETSGVVKNLGVSVFISAGTYAGGLAGVQSGGSIERSFSTGIVVSKPPSGNLSVAAGLVGSSDNGASISRSFSTASATSAPMGNQYVAGLVGSKGEGQVRDTYARGAANIQSLIYALYAGGFAGFLIDGTIERGYATGIVPADAGSMSNDFIGNVAPASVDNVSDSYFELRSGVSSGGSDGASGRSSAAMKDELTYTGWDFANTWAIHANVNDGYPYLRHEIVTTELPQGIMDMPYSFKLGAFVGADAALEWSAAGLPAGLTLSDAGKLEGTPTVSGSFDVVVTAVDAGSLSSQKSFELIVEAYAPEPAGFAIEPGVAYGTTRLSATPVSAGSAFHYTLTDNAVARPFIGAALPAEALDYRPGSDIAAESGRVLTLYEADLTGVQAWRSVLLAASHIQSSVGTVTGAVYGTSGAPLTGATVSIGAAQTTTDSAGGFTLANVAQGAQTLRAEAAGYDAKEVAVTVVAGASVDVGAIALTMSPIALTGVAIDGGDFAMIVGDAPRQLTATVQPANASDKAVAWSSNRTDVATVNASGEVAAIAPGFAVITVTTADGSFTDSVNVTVAPPAPTVGTVTGAVYGAGGAPLAGATVSIGAAQTMTDSTGGFTLANVPQGAQTILAVANGYDAKSVAVTVVAGASVDVGAIAMTAVESGSGTVGPTTSPSQPSDKLRLDWNGGVIELTFKKETAPDGRSVLRLTADETAVEALFATGDLAVLAIDNEESIVTLDLPADALLQARRNRPGAALELKTNEAGYRLPLRYWPSLPENGVVTIEIAASLGTESNAAKEELAAQGVELLAAPVEFKIYVDGKERTERGAAYTIRTIAFSGTPDVDEASVVRLDGDTSPRSMPSVFHTDANGVSEAVFYATHNSLYAVVRSKRTFSDVQGHWAQNDIERLASKLIVDGKSEERFDPESAVTRAEFAALLTRSIGLAEVSGAAALADVAANDWYAGGVGAAVDAGLVAGYEDGTFRPNAAITREQMAAMIDRAVRFVTSEPTAATGDFTTAFEDAGGMSDWAKPSIARLLEAKVMEGVSGSSFAPEAAATRAQCVVVIRRMLQHLEFINA